MCGQMAENTEKKTRKIPWHGGCNPTDMVSGKQAANALYCWAVFLALLSCVNVDPRTERRFFTEIAGTFSNDPFPQSQNYMNTFLTKVICYILFSHHFSTTFSEYGLLGLHIFQNLILMLNFKYILLLSFQLLFTIFKTFKII